MMPGEPRFREKTFQKEWNSGRITGDRPPAARRLCAEHQRSCSGKAQSPGTNQNMNGGIWGAKEKERRRGTMSLKPQERHEAAAPPAGDQSLPPAAAPEPCGKESHEIQ